MEKVRTYRIADMDELRNLLVIFQILTDEKIAKKYKKNEIISLLEWLFYLTVKAEDAAEIADKETPEEQ
ncbi:MAG: hypothetical protein MJZ16_14120 [Bacteroidales bacterium]|nr:hypothetical protein [Bacteroidales bacterium]